MSKNIEVKQISGALRSVIEKLQRYAGFLFVISVLLIYSFLVFRISLLSDPEADEAAIAEQMTTVKRLKVDQNSIDRIEQLEDQNVGVQSLFEEARDNPFQD